MFQIKTFVAITASMIGLVRRTTLAVTDFTIGAVNRTMLEAPAQEIDQLYQNMLAGLLEAIPTAIYLSFDFNYLPPNSGTTPVLFLADDPNNTSLITFPVGTSVSSIAGITYQTVEAGTIPAGQQETTINVACTQSGIIGNTGVGTIVTVAGVTGCTTCTNPAAVTNGSGQETEPQRKLRFVSFIKSLARGTNAALIYCAKSTTITDPNTGAVIELVARAVVEETPGHTNLWVYNGTGPMSSELQTAIQQAIDGYLDPATLAPVPGYRSSGMRCDVVPMAETPVDVTLLLEAATSYQNAVTIVAVQAAVAAAIAKVLNNSYLLPINLVNAALGVTGITGGDIVAPTQIVQCPNNAVLIGGTITVNWAAS